MSLAGAEAAGLSLDQAPPLWIPSAFFALVPLALIAAGLMLIVRGDATVGNHWAPAVMATVHVGTLGVLGSAMLGALYQMIPVVAGGPVPWVGLARVVFALWTLGVASLVWALLHVQPPAFTVAVHSLGTALALFLGPVAVGLARAPARHESARGMRVAVVALAVVGALGLRMGLGWSLGAPAAPRLTWLAAHAAVGLLCWVGGLLFSVSLTVVPMFYLAPPMEPRIARIGLAAVGLSLVALGLVPVLGLEPSLVALAAAPAALAVLVLHPIVMLGTIARRRRRRVDPSLRLWQFGLAMAPVVAVTGGLAAAVGGARLPLLAGWLAIFGWAAAIVHGMLTRIVPFLVWFHRFAPLAGRAPIPPMRRLLPAARIRPGLWAHGLAVVLGSAGILLDSGVLLEAAGLSLAAAGVVLGVGLARVWWRRLPGAQGAR